MTHNPNSDNINQNTGDYYLVFHGNDDESVHGGTTFENLYANKYSSYELNQTRSDQDESNSDSEESNSEESKADQENSDQDESNSEESKADQENSDQDESNTDESIADQENLDHQDGSSYENNLDRSIRFDEEDDVIVDGAYLSNELQILVGCWYNDFKRVPLKWRLVYILLLIFFTRLCFLEYRVYNLSRQTKMDMDVFKDFFNRSFASRDNELRKYIDMRMTDQVCPNVPTVQNPKKHHGRHHGPKIHRK